MIRVFGRRPRSLKLIFDESGKVPGCVLCSLVPVMIRENFNRLLMSREPRCARTRRLAVSAMADVSTDADLQAAPGGRFCPALHPGSRFCPAARPGSRF